MKQTIAWHEQCIRNMEDSLARSVSGLIRLELYISINNDRLVFYKRQVMEAKKKGKDSFDGDKFMVKKGIK